MRLGSPPSPHPKIVKPEDMHTWRRVQVGWGKLIVQCSGCFDLIHPGHIMHLQTARSWGDVLIVSLNTDEGVTRLKGVGRPILTLAERIVVLGGLSCVDYLTWFDDETPEQLIHQIKPNLYVKGSEYPVERIPELAAVFQYGAFRAVPRTAHSTTDLIRTVVSKTIQKPEVFSEHRDSL